MWRLWPGLGTGVLKVDISHLQSTSEQSAGGGTAGHDATGGAAASDTWTWRSVEEMMDVRTRRGSVLGVIYRRYVTRLLDDCSSRGIEVWGSKMKMKLILLLVVGCFCSGYLMLILMVILMVILTVILMLTLIVRLLVMW